MQTVKYFFSTFVMLLITSQLAFAHAFPVKNIPGAGAELAQSPGTVTIRFDDELEPMFSKLIVKNASGKQVSKGDGSVSKTNTKKLSTKLSSLSPGKYHVFWSVVSRDGHRTHGDYTFSINPQVKN